MRKKSKSNWADNLLAGAVITTIIVVAVGVGNWIWMTVWNLVIHGIFHGPALNYWQAMLVSIFIGFLKGGLTKSASK